MAEKIKIGIVGYGNVGKGAELALSSATDMELVGVFSRRDVKTLTSRFKTTKFIPYDDIYTYEGKVDVMLMCGGSATDLIEQSPYVAKKFNIVDTFDTHAKIPQYYRAVEESTKSSNTLGIISVGWDPGLFSMIRALSEAVLPNGKDYTFWGKGVSQGHSDAIRRVKGVKNAIQYTIPIDKAIKSVRNGEMPELSARQKHLRECYIVLEDNADKEQVEYDVKNMPYYFSDYDTIIHFISEEELKQNHSKMMHGGFVLRTGNTNENKQLIEYSLKLESNPEFTGSVMVAYARACYKLHNEGYSGVKTVLDVPISYLSKRNYEDLISTLL